MLRISGVQRKRLPRWKDWDMVLPRCGNAAVVFGEDSDGSSPARRDRGKDRRPDAVGRQGTGPSDEKATIAQNATREKPPGTTVIAGMQGGSAKL